MRTQAERDEQTLRIASVLLVGPIALFVLVVVSVMTGIDRPAVFAVAFAGYVVLVVLRLSRMSPWSASSSRASAPPSTPRPSSRRPRP